MSKESRLDRAMQVFLQCHEEGLDREVALAANPEVADLLRLLFAGDGATADDDAGAATAHADGDRAAMHEWFGDYRIDTEIGRGGMGSVYAATQRSLGRRVALKVLREEGIGPRQVARFRREAATLAKLDHAHIVGILDVGETRGRHWLAMEYIDGESLDHHLDELRARGGHRGSSLRRLIEVIADVADALQHVHQAGILHRDVKPSNILLRRDGFALLSDFGLARDANSPSLTHVGVIAGTPHYMSPEHLAGGDALLPASDVFSLGATLYECLTLERPFTGANNELVLRQILTTDPIDPRRLHHGLHADIAAIALTALEKEPRLRYATAAAFADDLRAFLELRPVRARTPSTVQKLQRWMRSEPWRAGLMASLVLCIGLVAFLMSQWPQVRAAEIERVERDFGVALDDGWLARTAKHEDAANAAFHRALSIHPHAAEAIAGLCLSIRAMAGIDAALAELDRLAPDADDPDLLTLAREVMLRTVGRMADADELVKVAPRVNSPMAMWLRGVSALVMAKRGSAEAKRACEQISLAARLSPRPRITLVVQWGIAASFADDQSGMRECARTLLQFWPEDARAVHYAALTLKSIDLPRAIELCRRARMGGMDLPESHWLEVALLDDAGRTAELLSAIEATLVYDWDDARHADLIALLGKAGDAERQFKAAEAWYRHSPDNAAAMRQMAIAWTLHDEFDRALELFGKIATQRPDDADALYDLAATQHMSYHDALARTNLEKVLALAPDHLRAHRRLLDLLGDANDAAAILAELGRWADTCKADVQAQMDYGKALFEGTPSQPLLALEVATRADRLAGGRNAAVLDLCGAVHAALGENASASRCRAAAAQLRDGH